jgi:hypothetical protein
MVSPIRRENFAMWVLRRGRPVYWIAHRMPAGTICGLAEEKSKTTVMVENSAAAKEVLRINPMFSVERY